MKCFVLFDDTRVQFHIFFNTQQLGNVYTNVFFAFDYIWKIILSKPWVEKKLFIQFIKNTYIDNKNRRKTQMYQKNIQFIYKKNLKLSNFIYFYKINIKLLMFTHTNCMKKRKLIKIVKVTMGIIVIVLFFSISTQTCLIKLFFFITFCIFSVWKSKVISFEQFETSYHIWILFDVLIAIFGFVRVKCIVKTTKIVYFKKYICKMNFHRRNYTNCSRETIKITHQLKVLITNYAVKNNYSFPEYEATRSW